MENLFLHLPNCLQRSQSWKPKSHHFSPVFSLASWLVAKKADPMKGLSLHHHHVPHRTKFWGQFRWHAAAQSVRETCLEQKPIFLARGRSHPSVHWAPSATSCANHLLCKTLAQTRPRNPWYVRPLKVGLLSVNKQQNPPDQMMKSESGWRSKSLAPLKHA